MSWVAVGAAEFGDPLAVVAVGAAVVGAPSATAAVLAVWAAVVGAPSATAAVVAVGAAALEHTSTAAMVAVGTAAVAAASVTPAAVTVAEGGAPVVAARAAVMATGHLPRRQLEVQLRLQQLGAASVATVSVAASGAAVVAVEATVVGAASVAADIAVEGEAAWVAVGAGEMGEVGAASAGPRWLLGRPGKACFLAGKQVLRSEWSLCPMSTKQVLRKQHPLLHGRHVRCQEDPCQEAHTYSPTPVPSACICLGTGYLAPNQSAFVLALLRGDFSDSGLLAKS